MQSLRKRPTYNELIDYLENKQPVIRYPDRRATFLRNSPYLSQFDGDSWIDLDEQENRINKEKLKEMEVRRLAGERGLTASVVRTQHYSMASSSSSSSSSSQGYDSAYTADFLSDMEHDQEEREAERTGIIERGKQMVSRMLGQTEEQIARPGFLPQGQSTQEDLPPLENLDEPATKIQKVVRGNIVRKRLNKKTPPEEEEEEQTGTTSTTGLLVSQKKHPHKHVIVYNNDIGYWKKKTFQLMI